jgi:hypothetical protein
MTNASSGAAVANLEAAAETTQTVLKDIHSKFRAQEQG